MLARRYPDPASRPAELGTETDINTHQQLCYHRVGTPQVGCRCCVLRRCGCAHTCVMARGPEFVRAAAAA